MNEPMIIAEFMGMRKFCYVAWSAHSDEQFIEIVREDQRRIRATQELANTFDEAVAWIRTEYERNPRIIRKSDFEENDEYLLDPRIFACAERLEWV